MTEYEKIEIYYDKGNGWVQFYVDPDSQIHVDSDDDFPAIVCVPQGRGLGKMLLEHLIKMAEEKSSKAVIIHQPNNALVHIVSQIADRKNLQLEKIPDYLGEGIVKMTLKLD